MFKAEWKPTSNCISLNNVTAGYKDNTIINNISFDVATGSFTILVGSNGSGKSTLLNTIARMIHPQGGCVSLNGKSIHTQPTRTIAQQMGILPQSPIVPDGLTVFELVSRGRFPWQGFIRHWSEEDEKAVTEALQLTDTMGIADEYVDNLSGGQRQRCWIALALAQSTPIILLDEPTTFLDLRYQVEILELLHNLTAHHGKTIIAVLHDLNFAVNYGDTLVFLKKGKIRGMANSTEDYTAELIRDVFEVEVQVSLNPITNKPYFIPFRSRKS